MTDLVPLLFGMGMLGAVVVSVAIHVVRRERLFREQFPPLTDGEFAALCRPGINPEVALRVRRILAESLALEEQRIYPSARLIADLGAE